MHPPARAQLKPYIQYYSYSAEIILKTSGRGSFIAPAVGFLHYGPSCYLYDHVCNFNYQGAHRPLRLQMRMQGCWLVACARPMLSYSAHTCAKHCKGEPGSPTACWGLKSLI